MTTIFKSWTRQAGFPLVTVERNYENGDIILAQERYLSVNESSPSTSLWWIPINYASASVADFDSTNATSWFSTPTYTLNDVTIRNSDWIVINKRQTGYYRVKYDLENYRLLSMQLLQNDTRIHLTTRSQLIDDAFDFARVERLHYDVVLDLMKYMENELEYLPWASAFNGLSLINRLYAGSAKFDKFAVSLN